MDTSGNSRIIAMSLTGTTEALGCVGRTENQVEQHSQRDRHVSSQALGKTRRALRVSYLSTEKTLPLNSPPGRKPRMSFTLPTGVKSTTPMDTRENSRAIAM